MIENILLLVIVGLFLAVVALSLLLHMAWVTHREYTIYMTERKAFDDFVSSEERVEND